MKLPYVAIKSNLSTLSLLEKNFTFYSLYDKAAILFDFT